MDECFVGGNAGLSATPLGDELVMFAPDAGSILADMGEECRFFSFRARR
jgi:hypothetical protein